MNNFCTLDKNILYICKYEFPCFLNKPNVFGVGLGYKSKNGFYTTQKCILVLVTQKIPSNNLPRNCCIPPCYKGIPTDVVECGNFSLSSLTGRIRPVPGGYSIGPSSYPYAGSLACLVKDAHSLYILSAGHVLTAEGTFGEDTPIIQPSASDGGRFIADRIAILKRIVPIHPDTATEHPLNYVDCGIAEVISPSLVTPNIALVGPLHGLGTPALHQNVKKVGKNSELTTGKITSLGMTIAIAFSGNRYTFANQIITTRMTVPGDSGSLLLDYHSNGLGLLMGSLDSMSIFNPLDAVLSNLGVSLVTS